MIIVGVVLTLFVVGIGVLVTRLVVDPVRRAAGTAQRLAEGQLEQRMVVRGEDDLARLATSFNAMADSLQRQITQLEGLSQLQQRFTSDVSHELRTPLTTVQMAAEVLHEARGDFPPHVARSAELLRAELDRFEGLLTDLLEISRYDAGAAELDAEATDLGALVARVVAGMYALAERHGCELVVNRPDEDVIAEVDARRVERILRNLVGNAIEHGAGRPVEITLGGQPAPRPPSRCATSAWACRSAEAQHVFDRFWRADPSRVRTVGGSGLGLSISLEDARLHGGWLQVWGQPGSGAQFRLTLPLTAGGGSDQLTAAAAPVRRCGGRGARRDAAGRARGGGAARAASSSLPACSTVPSSSPTVQITQAPARPVDEIGIEPLAPEPGATPGGHRPRASSTPRPAPGQGHPVARRAPRRPRRPARGRTRPGSRSSAPTTRRSRPSPARWRCRRDLVGTVDERGVFAVGGPEPFRREFTLEQVEGEWRITNPADGLIIAEPDFERLYDERRRLLPRPDRAARRPRPAPPHPGRGAADRAGAAPARGPVGARSPPACATRCPGSSCAPPSRSEGRRPTVDLTGLGHRSGAAAGARSARSWCGP